jgi:hypothetical protein
MSFLSGLKSFYQIGKSAVTGPFAWGLPGLSKSWTAKLAFPAALGVSWVAYKALGNLTEGGFSMHSPEAQWGYQRGMSSPYESNPMSFGQLNWSSSHTGATGSLAFALSNRRKG